MSNTKDSEELIIVGPKKIFAFIKEMGKLRDKFLVGGPIIYVIGYIVWSVNAFLNDLGLLPALESQYFLAGLILLLLMGLVYLLIWGGYYFISKYLVSPMKKGESKKGRKISVIVALCFGIFFCMALPLLLISGTEWFDKTFGQIADTLFLISLGVLTLILSIAPFAFNDRPFFRKGMPYYVLGFYLLFVVYIYIYVLYPIIPQELGGVGPRCAYVDVMKKEISDETIKAILPCGSIYSGSKVVRSLKLDVMFAGKDFILVRPHRKMRVSSSFWGLIRMMRKDEWFIKDKPTIYEIRKKVIQGVISCGEVGEWKGKSYTSHYCIGDI